MDQETVSIDAFLFAVKMYFSTLVVLCVMGVAMGNQLPKYEFKEEWLLWKRQHEKSYSTDLEELERHLVWLSNKKYIELHNANADVFGFTLAMNHLGDMVYIAMCMHANVHTPGPILFVHILLK